MRSLAQIMQAATTIADSAATPEFRDLHVWTQKPLTEAQQRRWMQSQRGPAQAFQEQCNAFGKHLRTLSNAQLRTRLISIRNGWTEEERANIPLPQVRNEILDAIEDAFAATWKVQFTKATGIPYEDTLDFDKYKAHLDRLARLKAQDAVQSSN